MSRAAIQRAIDLIEDFDMTRMANFSSRKAATIHHLHIALTEADDALEKAHHRGIIHATFFFCVVNTIVAALLLRSMGWL